MIPYSGYNVGDLIAEFLAQIGVPTRTLIKWENDQATPRGLALTTINEILDKILGN